MEHRQNDDEIDLGELLLKIRNALYGNKIMIFGFAFIGLLIGVLFFYLRSPVYESEMIIYSEVIEEPLISAVGENLNKFVEEQNHEELAKKLNVTLEVSSQIKSIEIDLDEEQKTKLGSFFTVRTNSIQSDQWNLINAGLVSYFSNNEYVNKRIQLKKENYQNLIAKLDNEIDQIDSLKSDLNGMDYKGRSNIMVLSPSTVYETLIQLYKDQLDSKENLQLTDAVEIVDVASYQKPVSAGIAKSAVIGFFVGLMLSFIIVFLLEMGQYLKRYEKA